MPRKQKKTKEEKIAENFFPIDPGDSKQIIEKKYKKPDTRSLEKVEKAPKRKQKATKSRTKKEFKIPKIKLKPKGYELIITEKPQAALKIASSLGKSTKKSDKNIPYYEVERDGKKIIVACAVGHLFTLKQNISGSEIPVFDIVWVPNSFVREKDFSKKYYDTLSKLIKNAGSLTVATDYDIEGEVIGLNVVRFIGGQKDANRMKFSTLTEKELNKAYEEKSKHIDWGQAIAGETRHYLDWFYGINLSRALMNAIKTTGKFRIMSIGRVQGPTLKLIVEKEKKISEFKAAPYWQIFIKLKDSKIEFLHNKDIFNKSELKKFENLIGKTGKAETKNTLQTLSPNPPFNLTKLQTEAYRLYSITPSKTLQAAQSLYLSGLISYPRTSSQKLPPSIGYREILKKLSKRYKAEKLITRKKPVEGKKSDPAHPSIYPTGNFKSLVGNEKRIYDLIVRRFLSLFIEDAVIENKTIKIEIEKLIFIKKGTKIKKKNWLEIYPIRIKETSLPQIKGDVKIVDLRIEEKETNPPNRYSPASIISELEKRNLGTKATRASILETLYYRNYIKDQSIKATPLGISLIETLEKHSPIIIDEALTREFEKGMGSIQSSKKFYKEKEEKILDMAKETIIKISKQFKKEEKAIGKELLTANLKLREEQKKENALNICPICKKGNLGITYSRKTKRQFVACDAYPKCKTTFSLPPNTGIKKEGKNCEACGFPKLISIKRGRKPWRFCFNPQCPTNRERIEAYRRKKESEGQ
jgi:DNA topoisomerase-1